MRSRSVVIVGGGVSGLAAGVALSSQGIHVTILEKKPFLGGRAFSFIDKKTGQNIDNGQHILIAGYQRTMAFLKEIGTHHLLNVQSIPSLAFYSREGLHRLSLPKLPPPLNLTFGALLSDLLSFRDRMKMFSPAVSMLRVGSKLNKVLGSMTVEDWLDRTNQSQESRQSFWRPIAISMLNEKTERACALPLVRSMATAFLGNWKNACIALPRVGLHQLLVAKAEELIRRNGGEIRNGVAAQRILLRGERVEAVSLNDHTTIECGGVIVATPPSNAKSLFGMSGIESEIIADLGRFRYSPIVSTHLWFERNFVEQDFVGLIGRTTQWVFNKNHAQKLPTKYGQLSTVISAAYDVVSLQNSEIIRLTLEDLAATFPTRIPRLAHAVVVRERAATFSPTPEAELLRLSPSSPAIARNMFVAGDWTDTGDPPTIEGAIFSGQESAKALINEI